VVGQIIIEELFKPLLQGASWQLRGWWPVLGAELGGRDDD
jgi:hypothetical protein